MAGDYSRYSFDPAKGFSGVHQQQGRVGLDADFNELEEILDRRSRAEMMDIVGRAVVPRTAPGFEITVDAATSRLLIGRGRAYVDGILVESFGNLPITKLEAQIGAAAGLHSVYDDALGGETGTGPMAFDAQPFFYPRLEDRPAFPAFPQDAKKLGLVYLDVWQREVTVYEDPSLREKALNGPDTATRVQTAWQVKVLANVEDDSCAASPPAWTALIAPSTARLTNQATRAGNAPVPCVIDPADGYTGVENRLYRVEIHRGGTLGDGNAATRPLMKWSRDNASLVARVTAVKPAGAGQSTVTVSSLGRDTWLRFGVGDTVELLDDAIEFGMRESNVGGWTAKILDADSDTGDILIDQDLTSFVVAGDRHPRLRRWDVAAGGGNALRPATPNGTLAIEEGISVTFVGDAAATVHAGDYWVFAARTADGSIDRLFEAPPRGILHHFAKLALIAPGKPPATQRDCRTFWPPNVGGGGTGCCTAVVKPGQSIQEAIDSLGGKGGCVCLKMGLHEIVKPLKIRQSNVTLHSEAPWVTVRKRGTDPLMLDIDGDALLRHVNVEGIRFEAVVEEAPRERRARAGVKEFGSLPEREISGIMREGKPNAEAANDLISILVKGDYASDAIIRAAHVRDVSISGCGVALRSARIRLDVTGIALRGCDDVSIDGSEVAGVAIGIDGLGCTDVRVAGNRLSAPSLEKREAASLGLVGIRFLAPDDEDLEGIVVESNEVADYRRGIMLGEPSVAERRLIGKMKNAVLLSDALPGCRIVDNAIWRQGADQHKRAEALVYGVTTDPSLGRQKAPSADAAIAFAITSTAPRCDVLGNIMNISGLRESGILVTGADVFVARNAVESSATMDFDDPATALPIGVLAYVTTGAPLACTVRDNLFSGLLQAVHAQGARGDDSTVSRVDVIHNRVAGSADFLKIYEETLTGLDDGGAAALLFLLRSVERYATIAVIDVEESTVAANAVSWSPCGVFVRGGTADVAGNDIANGVFGALVTGLVDSTVRDNRLDRLTVVGIAMSLCNQTTISGNCLVDCLAGIVQIAGRAVALLDNRLEGGKAAIGTLATQASVIRGNVISGASDEGIFLILPLDGTTVAGNRVQRVGYRTGRTESAKAYGIAALAPATITIEQCEVLDVGDTTDVGADPFLGARIGIAVYEGTDVRVRGCTVTSPEIDPGRGRIHSASRAIYIGSLSGEREAVKMAGAGGGANTEGGNDLFEEAGGDATPNVFRRRATRFKELPDEWFDESADVTDNVAAQSTRILVSVTTKGGLLFSANRCRNLVREAPRPSVVLQGQIVTATGNQIRAVGDGPSLSVATAVLSATGNVVSGAPMIAATSRNVPAPFEDFNAVI